MSVQDRHPHTTAHILEAEALLDRLTEQVGLGSLPASTDLFRACCELYLVTKCLMDTVERDLSIRLAEQQTRNGHVAEVTS